MPTLKGKDLKLFRDSQFSFTIISRSYSYYIEVSMNEEDWIRVIDYSDYMCRSWQNLNFKPVVAKFIKIVGVRNTSNRIFHLVSMEVRYTLEQYDLLTGLIGKKLTA